jgi:hypothetical protein
MGNSVPTPDFVPGTDPDIFVSREQSAVDIDTAADVIERHGLSRATYYDSATGRVCPLGALSEAIGDGTEVRYVRASDLMYYWLAAHAMPPMTVWVRDPEQCHDVHHAAQVLHAIAMDVRLGLV